MMVGVLMVVPTRFGSVVLVTVTTFVSDVITVGTAFTGVSRDVGFVQFGTTQGTRLNLELGLDALVHGSLVPCQVVALIGGVVTPRVVTLELWFGFVVNTALVLA